MEKKTLLELEIHGFDFEGLEQEAIGLFPKQTPAPGVIFIHGHIGNAYSSVSLGKRLIDRGYAAFLPSMMGYGNSAGTPDYCGPKTIEALYKGFEIFINDPRVDKKRVAIYGVSRGAMTAAQIITQNAFQFAAAVLEVGAYDFEKFYNDPHTPQGIKDTIVREISEPLHDGLHLRSAIRKAEQINCPVFILHGAQDERVNVEQAKFLDAELTRLNKQHELVIIENAKHDLRKFKRYSYIFPFLEKNLKH